MTETQLSDVVGNPDGADHAIIQAQRPEAERALEYISPMNLRTLTNGFTGKVSGDPLSYTHNDAQGKAAAEQFQANKLEGAPDVDDLRKNIIFDNRAADGPQVTVYFDDNQYYIERYTAGFGGVSRGWYGPFNDVESPVT